MSSINNVGNVGGNLPVQNTRTPAARQTADASGAAPPDRPADRLELSGMSHMLQALKTNGVRADKVASVKAQIQAGSYEDDHKLNVAAGRLLDDLVK